MDDSKRMLDEADKMISKAECGLAIATLTAALNEKDAEIERLRRALSVIAGGFAPAAEIAQEALDTPND